MKTYGLPKLFLVDMFPSVVVSDLIVLTHFDLEHGVVSTHFEAQKFAFSHKMLTFFSHFI